MRQYFGFFTCLFLLVSCSNSYDLYRSNESVESQAKESISRSVSEFTSSAIGSFSGELIIWPNTSIKSRIVKDIDQAHDRIDLNVYMLTDTDIIGSLVHAKERWVRVRVILEKTVYQTPNINKRAYNALKTAGVEVVWADEKRFNFDHAKYFIVDTSSMISTGNMTKTSLEKNRELFFFSEETTLKDMLEHIFDADFKNIPLDKSFGELYISPSDSRQKLEKMLLNATGSIFVYAETLSDESIISLLMKKRSEGLDVRVCLAKKKWESPDQKLLTSLLKAKIPVTQASGPYVHAKSLLIDQKILAVGSLNFTMNSFDNNREIGIFLKNPVFLGSYLSVFHKDCTFP